MIELNKIYNEDCLETMGRMPDEFIDLVVTSPPYDNLRTYDQSSGFHWDFKVFKKIAKELYRIVKIGGVVVWVVNDATINGSETGTCFKQALYFKSRGFNLHDTMIWEKPTFTATGALVTRYAQVFDYMFILTKKKIKTFNPIKDRKPKKIWKIHGTIRQKDGSMRKKSSIGKLCGDKPAQRFNIWKMNTACSNSNICHPAQFPEHLAKDHIISWSNEGDLVYDPFMGSGTTAIAAEQLGRRWIGSELSEEYCEIANKRIEEKTKQMTLI